MSKIVLGKAGHANITLDLATLLSTRMLLTSDSGGGKTHSLKRICEQAFGKIQIIIVDPEGEFSPLREKFDFVLAGKGGETPADTRSAALLALRLLETRASCICDIFEMKPSQRHEWVKLFLDGLIEAPKTTRHPVLVIVDEAHIFCLDEETEILTEDGWKLWDQTKPGDLAVCFDLPTEEYSYEPIERVILKHFDGEMVRLASDGIDSITTPDHRTVIQRTQRAKGRYKRYPWTFCQASRIPHHISVPIGGGPTNLDIPNLSLDMCELLGWIVTDGSWTAQHEGKRDYISISQSFSTNKLGQSMIEELSKLLERLGGKSCYQRAARTTQSMGRDLTHAPSVDFYLGVELSRKCLTWLGTEIHRMPRQILAFGSLAQLKCLYEGAVKGDGTSMDGSWTIFYAGLNEGLANDFQELATRLSISTTKKLVPQNGQWTVLIADERRAHYIRKPYSEPYKGLVWDITVRTGAFVARRHGKVFVTGNCPEKGKGESQASEAMISLCTRGRKRLLCPLFATQRLATLNKDASSMLLNRMIGPTFEDLNRKRAAEVLSIAKEDHQEFMKQIQLLEPGNFFVLGRALTRERTLMHVGPIETAHGQEAMKYDLTPPPAPENVKAMLPKLADLPKEAEEKAKTIAEFKSEIRSLKAQLREQPKTPVQVPVFDTKQIERATAPLRKALQEAMKILVKVTAFKADGKELSDEDLQKTLALIAKDIRQLAKEKLEDRVVELARLKRDATQIIAAIEKLTSKEPIKIDVTAVSPEERKTYPPPRPPYVPQPARANVELSNGDLKGPHKAILRALGELLSIGKESAPKPMVAAWAGYSPGGGAFMNPLGTLRSWGLVDYPTPGNVALTPAGREKVGPCEPPDQEEIHRRVRDVLPGPARKILSVLLELESGTELSKADLAERAGYSEGGGAFANPLGALRTAGFVDYPRSGYVRAADWLFMT